MRKTMLLMVVLVFAAILFGTNILYSQRKDKVSDILMSCVEALAGNEGFNQYETKTVRTWQDGPYLGSYGRYYYMVFTQTDCAGMGVVECLPGLTEKDVYAYSLFKE